MTSIFLFFFFNDTATTEIYTLSLHDALPIYKSNNLILGYNTSNESRKNVDGPYFPEVEILQGGRSYTTFGRSEEHTSELQSQSNLVCRLLLEKKNKTSSPQQDPPSAIRNVLP